MLLTLTGIISLKSLNRLVFIMGAKYVLCDVRTDIQYVCRFILVVGRAVPGAVSLLVLIEMTPF